MYVCYNSVLIFRGVFSCTLASTNPEGLKPMKLSGSPYKRYVHIPAMYHSVGKLAKFNLAIYENASLIFHKAYATQPYISYFKCIPLQTVQNSIKRIFFNCVPL